MDGGVSMVAQRRSTSETDSGTGTYKIPSAADFLVSFSSMEGKIFQILDLCMGPMISYRQEQLPQSLHCSYVQHGCYA